MVERFLAVLALRALSVGSVALGTAALSGCTPTTPTQVLVIFEAEAGLRRDGARLHIDVTNEDDQVLRWDVSFVGDDATSFPVTLPLVPKNSDANRTYRVHAFLYDSNSVLLAEARAHSGYVEDELREIRVFLTSDCVGVMCGESSTCVSGACETACVEPVPPGAPVRRCAGVDAGVDASVDALVDGGVDGGVDAGVDAFVDARAFDSGLDETACDDERPGVYFCDGFETLDFSAWDSEEGGVERSTDFAYRGAGALRVTTTEEVTRAFLSTAALQGVSGDLFIRLYVLVPEAASIEGDGFNLFFAGEGAEPFQGIYVGLSGGDRALVGGSRVSAPTGTNAFPRGRWTCVEGHVLLTPLTGAYDVWVNDAFGSTIASNETAPEAGVEVFNVGLPILKRDQGPLRLYIDEVVASSERIGCDL